MKKKVINEDDEEVDLPQFDCDDCTFYSSDPEESREHIEEHLCILQANFVNVFGEEW